MKKIFLQFFRFTISGRLFWLKKNIYVCLRWKLWTISCTRFQLSVARRCAGSSTSPSFFFVFKYKNYFYKFRYVPKYMRKNVDLCFYFLLKKKLGKSTFYLVLDKETPLRPWANLVTWSGWCMVLRSGNVFCN